MEKIWGRIAYNPSVDDAYFKKHLAHKYPGINTEYLFQAWTNASAAMVLANEQVTDTWRRDATWYPEMWSYSVDGGGQYSLNNTKSAKPMPGSNLCDISSSANNNCGGKISAWDNADNIEELAMAAKQYLGALDFGTDIDLKYNLRDIKSLANLSLYSGNKYRAAMYSIDGNQSEARDAMAKSYCYWMEYTASMDEMYIGVDLQRNQEFANWHVYDDEVLSDYRSLGGNGTPSCDDVVGLENANEKALSRSAD